MSLPRPVLLLLQIALFAALMVGLHLGVGRVIALTLDRPGQPLAMLGVATLGAILLAYALLIAVPFVPGVEIGLSLMILRGAEVAPFVYLATLAGLILAFLVGRRVPPERLAALAGTVRLGRVARLLDEIAPLSPDQRLFLLRRNLPRRIGGAALRWRYLALAAAINLPGSALIGGGGGISLIAGLSRLFGPRATMLTLALAVAPVPLTVWLTGTV